MEIPVKNLNVTKHDDSSAEKIYSTSSVRNENPPKDQFCRPWVEQQGMSCQSSQQQYESREDIGLILVQSTVFLEIF